MKTEKMKSDKAYGILRKYFDGLLSSRHIQTVRKWLAAADGDTAVTDALHRIWDQTEEGMDAPDVDDALDRFRHRREQYEAHRQRMGFYKNLLKYASLIALPLITGYLTWHLTVRKESQASRMVVCRVADGDMKHIELSDGTKMTVNGGSTVIYPEHFSRWNDRIIYASGEVFLDVAHDADRPFQVNVENLNIKVLGTRFNIRAYTDEADITTSLLEGSIQLTTEDTAVVMKPHEHLVYTRAGKGIETFKASTAGEEAWTEGKLKFEQKPLKDIVPVLIHKYNVRFHIDNSVDMEEKYNMSFDRSEDIRDVLDVLTKLSQQLEYEIKDNHVTLYKKQKGGKRQ